MMQQQEQLTQNGTAPDDSYASHDASVNGSSFIDDYDPEHQQAEDARHAYTDDGAYSDRTHARHHWNNHDQDPYARQGLFDDDRPPDSSEMW